MVDAVSQQRHHKIQAAKVHNFLTEFVPDREARKGGTQFTENTGVICECCRGETMNGVRMGAAESRCFTLLHSNKKKETGNSEFPLLY